MMLGVDELSHVFLFLSIRDCLKYIIVCKKWLKAFKKGLHKRNIDLTYTKVTNEGLKYFQGAHTIYLSYTNVTDEGLKYLTGAHTIYLWNTDVTNEGLKYLRGGHTIYLSGPRVTDEGLKNLEGFHTIFLWNTNNVTDEGLQFLKKSGTQKIIKW